MKAIIFYGPRYWNPSLITLSLFLFSAIWIYSCADYDLHYSQDGSAWEGRAPDPERALAHTVYLIGDAGDAEPQDLSPALRLLERKLRQASTNSSVLFLGDNIYPNGMAPKEEAAERARDEARLRAQLDILKGYAGRIYFVAGNHDWYGYGLDGLKRQRRFVKKYLEDLGIEQDDIFLPDPGCGDPEEIDIDDNLVFILLDSQWWLTDWKGEPEINEGCNVKSREVFRTYFEEAIKGNRSKNVVVAMHHPLYSNGPHGGQFTFRQHLFPLTDANKNLWVPLPVIGSIYPFLRATVGSKQDLAHPDYKDLRNLMVTAARKNGSFIFASGHEHSLQYLEHEEQFFVVSGSGSKKSAAKMGNNAAFVYGHPGIAQLDFYEDGSAWVSYWAADEEGAPDRLVFRKKIKGPLAGLEDNEKREFPLYESGVDSVEMRLGEYDFSRSKFGRFLWGDHYRNTYATAIKIPVLDLEHFKGGLDPVKRGGGYQTNSLRLEKENGQQYTMRALDKDPARMVAYPLNESKVILDIIKDSFSGAHPLSATPLPAMQDAVNLYHTNPKLYYVPKQSRLKNFNEDHGDALYLVEERPDDEVWREHPNFGRPEELLSTEDVVEEIQEDHDHVIDKHWVARARLFDFTIGDWDRHDDQWRWAKIDQGDTVYYRPVPRDRDQAMSKYDGFLFSIARESVPAARPLRKFKPHQKRIWWSNFGSRFFDNTFLNGLEWEDWQRQVRYIQTHLTDEVIDRAFRDAWPESIYALDAPEITKTIRARRDTLMDLARRFYDFHARKVDVIGTEERDLFEVQRLNDEETLVRVYDTNREREKEGLFYERTFLTRETDELFLYGLDDEDVFRVTGDVKKGIKIRLIGGLGKDVFIDRSRVGGLKKKTLIYDVSSEDNHFELGKEARLRISPDPKYNTYNRLSHDYDFNWWMFLPSVGVNPDDGLLLGAAAQYTTYGYKKRPHASQHFFSAKFAFETSGLELLHTSEFIDAIGDWEVRLGARYRSPLYATNFYGFGNETENPEEEKGMDYNRVRQREIAFQPSFMKITNSATRLFFGPTFESIKVERTEGRILDDLIENEGAVVDEEFFEGQDFLGLRFVFNYNNVDDPVFPARGLKFFVDAGWKFQLQNSARNFPYVDAFVAGFQPIDSRHKLVFGTRIGVEHRFNNKFEFYQSATLGGTGQGANFRGFRRDRFSGNTAFYQSTDLRWALLESNNKALPFSMGIFGGFDHGRVWFDGEDSNKWHYSYGGGVFLEPLDMIALQFSAFRGDNEEWRFVLIGNFFF